MKNNEKLIISLFDHSLHWVKPYIVNGYDVRAYDLQDGYDILESLSWIASGGIDDKPIYGILAAVPCTCFAVSGNRHRKTHLSTKKVFKCKCCKTDHEHNVLLACATIEIIEIANPKFWCIENPITELHKYVPEVGKPKMYFNPFQYGDPYSKKTTLFGNFNTKLEGQQALNLYGSEMHTKYGGSSLKTKNARSTTPAGFANAFFKANP